MMVVLMTIVVRMVMMMLTMMAMMMRMMMVMAISPHVYTKSPTQQVYACACMQPISAL